ncbi:MAG: NAD-dependent epimerase/dehydratase family protein [Acutalibacteraceae bacterium]
MRYTKGYTEDLISVYADIVNADKLADCSILITGATGLIGSAVADVLLAGKKLLQKTYTVTLASRNPQKIKERFDFWDGSFQAVEYDACKEIAFRERYDYIIHCAGNAHPAVYAAYPAETMMTNVVGTNNILKYALQSGTKRVLYVSSSEVYGTKPGNELYKETDFYGIDMQNARGCYPLSKCASENLCVAFLKEYGVDSVIVRPGHIYGPMITKEDSRAHAQFLRNVLDGQDIVMKSPGLQLRSYCHALDCATAMLTVLLSGASAQAYNISNRESVVTIRQFAQMHAELAGKKIIFDMPTNAEKEGYTMMTCSALNADKLYALGWSGRYDLRAGVSQTIRACTD